MHIKYWRRNQTERDHWENQYVGGWMIVSYYLKITRRKVELCCGICVVPGDYLRLI
jgi:hypothetical protein